MCKAIMKQRQQQKVVIIQFANIESPVNELPSSMNRVSTVVARVRKICSCIVTYQLLADFVCKVLVGD